MSYFNRNKFNNSGFETESETKPKPEQNTTSKKSGITAKKVSGAVDMASSLLADDSLNLDQNGNTDYSGLSNQEATGGAATVATDTLGMAAKGLAVGGVPGAIAGGVLGLGKSLFGQAKKRRELSLAKEKFQNKQQHKSLSAINKIGEANRMDNIVDEDNLAYIENLKNSPQYNRFKRNSQYTI